MQSRVIKLTVELAVFVHDERTVGEPVEADFAGLDRAIQQAVKSAVPGAHSTGECKIVARVDGRYDVRKMRKMDGGTRYR